MEKPPRRETADSEALGRRTGKLEREILHECEPSSKRRKSGDGVQISQEDSEPGDLASPRLERDASTLKSNAALAGANDFALQDSGVQRVGGTALSVQPAVTTELNPKSAIFDVAKAATSPPVSPISPLESASMLHLRKKYGCELEYMLREFRKLERQLLGANRASQLEESAGSRERREKLHSFILHLEDTVRQIEFGCKLEAETKGASVAAPDSGKRITGKARADERGASGFLFDGEGDMGSPKEKKAENAQKLEEHILANLLPVKVRLKKQLAAQQGATRNPAGMPAPRRGMLQSSTAAGRGKGTFVAAAEQRRKQAEEARNATLPQSETQLSDSRCGGGSSLTQKLHGTIRGAAGSEVSGVTGRNIVSEVSHREVLYAGIVPGSTQRHSGVAAASGAHDMVVEQPQLLKSSSEADVANFPITTDSAASVVDNNGAYNTRTPLASSSPPKSSTQVKPSSGQGAALDADNLPLSGSSRRDGEKKEQRRRRKKKKLQRIARRKERERQRQVMLHHQTEQAAQAVSLSAAPGRKKGIHVKIQGKKGGPRSVEYICALCSEVYSSTCDYNPWWALAQHECPKCRKTQIPRIDITSPANAIEYHPALLAHAEDNGSAGTTSNASVLEASLPAAPFLQSCSVKLSSCSSCAHHCASERDSESDDSDFSDGACSEGSVDSDESRVEALSMSPTEQAERETFGYEYKGPTLCNSDSAKLLVLMCHAGTCACQHRMTTQRNICKATKYMMLHVRDCPGTTATFDVCPFPWCRKVKHILYHLISCTSPNLCPICSPTDLSHSFKMLSSLTDHRKVARKTGARAPDAYCLFDQCKSGVPQQNESRDNELSTRYKSEFCIRSTSGGINIEDKKGSGIDKATKSTNPRSSTRLSQPTQKSSAGVVSLSSSDASKEHHCPESVSIVSRVQDTAGTCKTDEGADSSAGAEILSSNSSCFPSVLFDSAQNETYLSVCNDQGETESSESRPHERNTSLRSGDEQVGLAPLSTVTEENPAPEIADAGETVGGDDSAQSRSQIVNQPVDIHASCQRSGAEALATKGSYSTSVQGEKSAEGANVRKVEGNLQGVGRENSDQASIDVHPHSNNPRVDAKATSGADAVKVGG